MKMISWALEGSIAGADLILSGEKVTRDRKSSSQRT